MDGADGGGENGIAVGSSPAPEAVVVRAASANLSAAVVELRGDLVTQGARAPAPPDDPESDSALAVEVLVLWEGDALAVSHFSLPADIFAGESASDCDILLPSGQTWARFRIATARCGQVHAVLPLGVVAWLTLPDGGSHPVSDAGEASSPGAPPRSERLLPLKPGSRAHLRFGALEVQIAPVRLEQLRVRHWSDLMDLRMLAYFGACAMLMAGLLAVLATMASWGGRAGSEGADQLHRMREYLVASQQRLKPPRGDELAPDATSANRGTTLPAARWRSEETAPSAVDEPVSSDVRRTTEPRATVAPTSRERRDLARDEGASRREKGDDEEKRNLHGLRTIGGGEGRWPESIPHHLGKITGSYDGGLAVWGRLSEKAVQQAIDSHSPTIRSCYDDERKANPTLRGRAMMRVLIEPDGHVQRVNTLGSELASKTVLRCLERVFYGIRFPKPDSGTVMVTYPLELSP